MGRKGVSKRKESKKQSKPSSVDKVSSSVSSVVKAAESQPIKSLDTDKAVPSSKAGKKPTADSRKKSKKG
ncbi:MAG: hypothetical protein P4L50_19330 [Anaerolineaceae bacterium]|nr:hypothetical protein [Anaerolineaceae bacterium]